MARRKRLFPKGLQIIHELDAAVHSLWITLWKIHKNSRSVKNCYHLRRMKPLDDLFVVDLSRILSGPICTMLMGDMGASVIKHPARS